MKTAKRLKQYRNLCERETGDPAGEIELNLLHLLNDLCTALRMPKTKRRQVLGRKGVQMLAQDREWTVALPKQK